MFCYFGVTEMTKKVKIFLNQGVRRWTRRVLKILLMTNVPIILIVLDFYVLEYHSLTFQVVGLAMVMYFIYLLLNMVVGSPEDHVSTGVHQTVGACDVFDKDISGHERQVYLCR